MINSKVYFLSATPHTRCSLSLKSPIITFYVVGHPSVEA